jgi:hypothetical protein
MHAAWTLVAELAGAIRNAKTLGREAGGRVYWLLPPRRSQVSLVLLREYFLGEAHRLQFLIFRGFAIGN